MPNRNRLHWGRPDGAPKCGSPNGAITDVIDDITCGNCRLQTKRPKGYWDDKPQPKLTPGKRPVKATGNVYKDLGIPDMTLPKDVRDEVVFGPSGKKLPSAKPVGTITIKPEPERELMVFWGDDSCVKCYAYLKGDKKSVVILCPEHRVAELRVTAA